MGLVGLTEDEVPRTLACLKPEERPAACRQNVGMVREEGTGRALGMTLKKAERKVSLAGDRGRNYLKD